MNETIKLIIVEDNHSHKDLLARAFENENNIIIRWCESTKHAFYALETKEYDIILTDYLLNDGTGLDLLENETIKIPLILMTSCGNEDLAVKALKLGASDYIVKSAESFRQLPNIVQQIYSENKEKFVLKKTQAALLDSEERYRLALEGSADIIFDWNLSLNLLYFSKPVYKILGFPNLQNEHHLCNWLKLMDYEQRKQFIINLKEHIQGRTPYFLYEYNLKNSKGETFWVATRGKALMGENGKLKRISGSITNITERRNYEKRIESLAFYDQLTGLPNRAMFFEYLNKMFFSTGSSTCVSVFYIDIDNFKNINDTYGHNIGDAVLKEVGQSLSSLDTSKGLKARIGGDEFSLILENIEDIDILINIAEQIKSSFEKVIWVEGLKFFLTASIGIASSPKDGNNLSDLLKNADTAMYYAKDSGKNTYAFFNNFMHQEQLNKTDLIDELHMALEKNEFELYYQPQIDVLSGRIFGLEALIRWRSPLHGLVLPNEFIKLVEESGLIINLGTWIFKKVCIFCQELINKDITNICISVNVSVKQLTHRSFVEFILNTISEMNIPPSMLGVEITESSMMESFDINSAKLIELKSHGIKIFLDDFGTGYSSLNYLKNLPIDVVKIDKSFISDISNKETDNILIKSLISLSHNLDLKVIAEGVETIEQIRSLIEYNCDFFQGFFYSKPVPENEVYQILFSNNTLNILSTLKESI